MRWIVFVSFCFLALCSGRPQDDCHMAGGCDASTPSSTTSTTTSAPDSTEGAGMDDQDEMDDMDEMGDEGSGDMDSGVGYGAVVSVKAKGMLARQGEIRAPRPRPIPGPIPSTPKVAFSVRKADDRTRAGRRVRFQNLLTNTGLGWRRRNSHFVAPYSGGYYFAFHAVSDEQQDFTMALMLNGRFQVTAYGARDGYHHGSNSVFLELRRGQRVHLQLQEGSIYEHPGQEAYTTFTGFMLYRD